MKTDIVRDALKFLKKQGKVTTSGVGRSTVYYLLPREIEEPLVLPIVVEEPELK